MTMLKLRLFGGFELTGAVGPPLPTRKAEALLAYLAVSAGRAQRRDKLAALLWGDRGDAQARHNLAQTLYVIRRTLGRQDRSALIVDSRSVTLDTSRIEIDVIKFERLAAKGTPISLSEAVGIYQDEMLAAFHLPDEFFEEWLLTDRRRLHSLALVAMERLLRHQFGELDDAAAIETAGRLLALDPLHESVHRTLMRLHHRAGRKSAAVRQYQTCAKVLRQELDIEPDLATEALYREIVSDRSIAAEMRDTQISTTASHELEPTEHPIVFTEENNGNAVQSFLHVIDLGRDYKPPVTRLDWVQVKDANHDRKIGPKSSQVSNLKTITPATYLDGSFGKAVEALSAIYRLIMPSEQEAAERRRSYRDRMRVVRPSMTWSFHSIMPGGITISIRSVPFLSAVLGVSAPASRPYVDAARALGYSHARIILRHMLPNVMAPYFVNHPR